MESSKQNALKQQIGILKSENFKTESERDKLLVRLEHMQEELDIFGARNQILVKKHRRIDPSIYKSMCDKIKQLSDKVSELSVANKRVINARDNANKKFKQDINSHKEIITKLRK